MNPFSSVFVAAVVRRLQAVGCLVTTNLINTKEGRRYQLVVAHSGKALTARLLSSPSRTADLHWAFRGDGSRLGGTFSSKASGLAAVERSFLDELGV